MGEDGRDVHVEDEGGADPHGGDNDRLVAHDAADDGNRQQHGAQPVDRRAVTDAGHVRPRVAVDGGVAAEGV